MKIFILLVVAFISLVGAHIADHLDPINNGDGKKYYLTEAICKNIFNLTDQELLDFELHRTPVMPEKVCYFKCAGMFHGTIDKDGFYDREFIKSVTGPRYPDAEKCFNSPGETVCYQAMNTYRCYLDNRLISKAP